MFSKDFSRKISIGRYRNKTYKHFINLIKTAVILLAVLLVVSCGGGGGGGVVSFQNGQQIHNGGDSGGWGTGNQTGNGFNPEGQSIEEAEAGLLISQMAALSGITGVTIELTINGTPYPAINADATTTTAVLPKIKAGDKISGKATINLSNGDPRVAYLDETEATLHGVLKFKVPYNYTANDLSGQPVASGTYFARDGINLAAQTVDPIAGWQCVEDGTTHYGSYVAGVRGDITLNAVTASGAPVLNASASPEILYATATSGDTTTITITGVTGSPQVSSISPELEQQGSIVPDNASNPTSYTLTVKIKDDPTGNPVWFNDDITANVTITDDKGIPTSVALTLKNKYTFIVADADNTSHGQGDKVEGTQYSFDDLKNMITIPAGREVVAFKEGTRIFKESDFPITLGSSTFTQRLVRLKAVLDFGMTITGGRGDGAAHTGTAADPYILKYNGTDDTDETKITVTVTSNIGSIIARNADITGKLTIGHPGSTTATQYITINKTALAATAIPAAGLTYQIVVRDYQEGVPGAADNDAYLYASKTFWVKIPQPEFTVSFNTGTGGSTAPSAQTITCGSYATAPTANPTNSDTSLVFGGWYTSTNGGTTLSSTAYNFGTTPVTEDITLYAKWLHSNFTGTAAEFLAAAFVPNNTAASSYTVTITSATPNEISNIAKAIGWATDSHYKGVYINLDLSGCGATSIPASAFNKWRENSSNHLSENIATYLTGITLPTGLTDIGSSAFSGCEGITGTVTIPGTVTNMGEKIFSSCTGITGVVIESGVTKIYNYAFQNCSNITGTVVIPDSVTEIGDRAFQNCSNISDFTVSGTWDGHWLSPSGNITDENATLTKGKLTGSMYYYIRRQPQP